MSSVFTCFRNDTTISDWESRGCAEESSVVGGVGGAGQSLIGGGGGGVGALAFGGRGFMGLVRRGSPGALSGSSSS